MTKYRLLGLAVILLVIATLACGGSPDEPPPPTEAPVPTQAPPTEVPPPTEAPEPTKAPDPVGEMATLVLENESEATVCYVFISPPEDDSWGEDWLGESEIIEPGNTRAFEVEAGTYDLGAFDCEEEELDTRQAQDLDGTVTWTISEVAASSGDVTLSISGEPSFGSVDLTANFLPDPYTIDLTSGGIVDVAALGLDSECTGYAASAPDVRLNMVDDADVLRVFFVAADEADSTLIINDPYGNWLCNDDFDGWDPLVEIENATSGQYDIWVGSRSVEDSSMGTLYITEMEYDPASFSMGVSPDTGSGSLDVSAEPSYGVAELSTGFQPDPHEVTLLSGGSVDVFAELGSDCGGYATNAPDYRVNLAQDSARLRIFFVAADEADSTLIISGPDGNWYCNDDFTGWNPMVELENATGGQYDIWVGTYSADEYINGTLYITEMDYDPDNLP